jgi:hypothetical protein
MICCEMHLLLADVLAVCWGRWMVRSMSMAESGEVGCW